MKSDDPLDRLAAEEDWGSRARAVERSVSRDSRKIRLPRRPRGRSPISLLFVALVALTVGSGVTLWAGIGPVAASVFVFVLSFWLVTLCLHEFSHALTAHRGGDDTVAGKGYLRLDLRTYGHWLLTIVLPLFFLISGGLPLPGGAVMIETHRLRNRFRDALVSAMGPAVNVAAAIILLLVVALLGPAAIYSTAEPHAPFWAALTFVAFLQVATAILNLLPIPGLDGYGIIEPYLPDRQRWAGQKIKPYGVLALFVLLYLPPVRDAFGILCDGVMTIGGAPINGTYYGYDLFQFWK